MTGTVLDKGTAWRLSGVYFLHRKRAHKEQLQHCDVFGSYTAEELIFAAVVCQAGDSDDHIDDGDDETEPEERAVDDLRQQLPLIDD